VPARLPRPRALPLLATGALVFAIALPGAGAGPPDVPAPPPRPPPLVLVVATPPAPSATGLVRIDARAGTVAALRSDGCLLLSDPDDTSRRVIPRVADDEELRTFAVAGDGAVVGVTTRARVVVVRRDGAVTVLPVRVQRSARPTAIPRSPDVILGSENGAIRRLVRAEDGTARLVDLVSPGDAPVSALCATAERVVYGRLDGFLLSIPPEGGDPVVLGRGGPVIRELAASEGVVARIDADGRVALSRRHPSGVEDLELPDAADVLALSEDGRLLATAFEGRIAVERTGAGGRVETAALVARRPLALVFVRGVHGTDRLLVATATADRPLALDVRTEGAGSRTSPTAPVR
jgi:hypothetical protein